MDRAVYNQLAAALALPVSAVPHYGLLQQRFPGVRRDSLVALLAQEGQVAVIKRHHLHMAAMPAYLARYAAGEDMLALAAAVDFPPALLARRLAELALGLAKGGRGADVMRQPALLPRVWEEQRQRGEAADISAELVARLQADVLRCAAADRSYSLASDAAKQIAGVEHELLLCARLRAAGIAFWSEDDLRAQGMHKTPDVRLQVPICVWDGRRGAHRLVAWIDSKATFGDDRTHQQQLEGQYRTYFNRYGPGLVIYWFGFIADLDAGDEVMLASDFPPPEHIQQL